MKLPGNISDLSFHHDISEISGPYPPKGFVPFANHSFGNGDFFGFYWPIGQEDKEPLIAEMMHDDRSVVPAYSCLDAFRVATKKLEKLYHPGQPSLSQDQNSPVALYEEAKLRLKNKQLDNAIHLLERCISIIPEYVEAASLLALQYKRINEIEKAIKISIKVIISPWCWGKPLPNLLYWFINQKQTLDSEVAQDPIWLARDDLFLKKSKKLNIDILKSTISEYVLQKNGINAILAYQQYGYLMVCESHNIQKKHGFSQQIYLSEQNNIYKNCLDSIRETDL